jgi:hypothetical protein
VPGPGQNHDRYGEDVEGDQLDLAANNNGSAFAGISVNTGFYNTAYSGRRWSPQPGGLTDEPEAGVEDEWVVDAPQT